MSAALAEIRARFGSIDWLVHAAGLPGSSLMQTKTVDEAESVLAPKVLGTLLLDRHFRDEPLQLMVLCSSLNAVFGEPGTSDYSAANAYLDAFAAAHSRPDRPIVAIGWDAWREVGMAAKAAMSIGRPAVKAAMTDYFRASPETMFSLDEHRIMGIPTLPGTAYLQLALRAVERREAVGTMALSRITFTAPLSVADGHEARIRTSLTEEKEGYAFTVASRIERGAWQVHATGKIARIDYASWGRHDVGAIFARCAQRAITRFPDASTDIVAYGPRWMDSFRGGGGRARSGGAHRVARAVRGRSRDLHSPSRSARRCSRLCRSIVGHRRLRALLLWQDNASRAVAPDCCEPRSVGRTPLGCEHVVVPGHAHVRSWRRTRRDRGLLVHGAPRASVRKRGRSKAGTCGKPSSAPSGARHVVRRGN